MIIMCDGGLAWSRCQCSVFSLVLFSSSIQHRCRGRRDTAAWNSISTSPCGFALSPPQCANKLALFRILRNELTLNRPIDARSPAAEMMDWTGGVRRRFAPGKNNAVIQKQKAHFAKARSALQDLASSKSSFRTAHYGTTASSKDHRSSTRHKDAVRTINPRRTSQWPEGRGASVIRHHEDAGSPASGSHRPSKKHSEIIHITSSSVPSTADSSLAHGNAVPPSQSQPQSAHDVKDTTTEEERLLAANRRRLLARPDWLGLSATKPVQIKFRSSHDKHRIGKRRKVAQSTTHKGQPATRRLITPLLEERLLLDQQLMSGALPNDEVQVKIGADALASHTQLSRHSHTPRLNTGRLPSSDLGPLSEEPMLLGDEGDMFEAIRSPQMRLSGSNDGRIPAMSEDDCRSANQRMYAPSQADDQYLQILPMQWSPEVAQMVQYQRAESEAEDRHLHDTAAANPRPADSNESYSDGVESNSPPQMSFHDPEHVTASRGTHMATDCDERPHKSRDAADDEAFWRRLMQFEDHTPSNPSLDAVKSSSLHVTASDSTHRPVVLPAISEGSLGIHRIPSTPKGAGTQESMLHDDVGTSQFRNSSESLLLASPSASLQRIQKLAEQPPSAVLQHSKEVKEDAAWRDFIIGSQSSSGESTHHQDEGQDHAQVDSEIDRNSQLSLLEMSGLGTSVVSTAGGTQRSRNGPKNLHAEKYQPARKRQGMQPATQKLRHSSPSTAIHGIDVDSIDDSLSQSAGCSRTTVPAKSSILNPKRFESLNQRRRKISSSTPGAFAPAKGGIRAKDGAQTK